MIAAFLIVFREVLEAGLVVGVVLAATRGIAGRGFWIMVGIGAGLLGAGLVAGFANEIAALFEGAGQELLNAVVLILAVAMLAWHNAWMARHGRDLARDLAAVGRDVAQGRRPLTALAIVSGVAVLREGSEVVLFLYGVAAGGGARMIDMIGGSVLGILAAAALSTLLYLGLISIPLKYLFGSLTALITLLAAGLAAQAVDVLQQGGWLRIWSAPVWDTSAVLSQGGVAGRVLHVLIGYTDRPTELDLLAYLSVVVAMVGLLRLAASRGGTETGESRFLDAP